MTDADPHRLQRFLTAQEPVYADALDELRRGRKTGHWMWFIFPQAAGLGYSSTSHFYAIRSPAEAWAYLQHPVLGARLAECARAILAVPPGPIKAIFGEVDSKKLHSSMTLFAGVADPGSVFTEVLKQYYAGQSDPYTIHWLGLDAA